MIMKEKLIEIKIYLKGKKRPFIAEVSSFDKVDEFKKLLSLCNENSVVTFGPLTFDRREFRYFIVK